MASCVEITEIKIPHTRPILSGTPGDWKTPPIYGTVINWETSQISRAWKKCDWSKPSKKNGSYVVAKKIRKNDFDSFTEFILYMFVQLLKNQSYQLSGFPKYKSEAVSLSVQWKTQAIPLNHDGRKGESFLKLNMKRDFFRRVNIELSLNLLPIFWKLVF